MEIEIVTFPVIKDNRGSLIALESYRNIPFEIKRVYYIFGNDVDTVRGKHAHKELKQILICISGSCKVLLDDGKEKEEVILDSPDKGLYIGPWIWREMYQFSSNCVLMVLASDFYNENDYIRNYEVFYELLQRINFSESLEYNNRAE